MGRERDMEEQTKVGRSSKMRKDQDSLDGDAVFISQIITNKKRPQKKRKKGGDPSLNLNYLGTNSGNTTASRETCVDTATDVLDHQECQTTGKRTKIFKGRGEKQKSGGRKLSRPCFS